MERDAIQICKALMTGILASGGANWEEASQTVDDVMDDCLTDPEYAEVFVRHLRAELEARHGRLQFEMGRFVFVTPRRH